MFAAAQTLAHYEGKARFNSNDRAFIIERGFQEWLLAAANNNCASGNAAGASNRSPARHNGRKREELVILIANLIGGAVYEQN